MSGQRLSGRVERIVKEGVIVTLNLGEEEETEDERRERESEEDREGGGGRKREKLEVRGLLAAKLLPPQFQVKYIHLLSTIGVYAVVSLFDIYTFIFIFFSCIILFIINELF